MTDLAAIKVARLTESQYEELHAALVTAAADGLAAQGDTNTRRTVIAWLARFESNTPDRARAERAEAEVDRLLALLADTPSVEPGLTPENIDKFTDAQFTAFMHATGFDAGITEALAEANDGKVPLYTRDRPSVEPAGLDETRDPWRCPTCGAGLHGTDVEHAAALPTQASDSPEKTT